MDVVFPLISTFFRFVQPLKAPSSIEDISPLLINAVNEVAPWIADGLYKSKETSDELAGYTSLEKTVTLWGLDNIEAEDFQGATSLALLCSSVK